MKYILSLVILLFVLNDSLYGQDKVCISSRDFNEIDSALETYEHYLDSLKFHPQKMLWVMKVNDGVSRSYTLSFIVTTGTFTKYLYNYNYYYLYNSKKIVLVGDYRFKGNAIDKLNVIDSLEHVNIYSKLVNTTDKDKFTEIIYLKMTPSIIYSKGGKNINYYRERSELPLKQNPFKVKEMYPWKDLPLLED